NNVTYFIKKKLYKTCIKYCQETLEKESKLFMELIFHFCEIVTDRTELNLQNCIKLKKESVKTDYELMCLMIILYGYQVTGQSRYKEEIENIDKEVKLLRKKANSNNLYYAGLFMYLNNKITQAKEYVERSVKQNGKNVNAINLLGWICFENNDLDAKKKCTEYYQKALKIHVNVESLWLKYEYLFYNEKYNDCQSVLHEMDQFLKFRPKGNLKMELYYQMLLIDEAVECCLVLKNDYITKDKAYLYLINYHFNIKNDNQTTIEYIDEYVNNTELIEKTYFEVTLKQIVFMTYHDVEINESLQKNLSNPTCTNKLSSFILNYLVTILNYGCGEFEKCINLIKKMLESNKLSGNMNKQINLQLLLAMSHLKLGKQLEATKLLHILKECQDPEKLEKISKYHYIKVLLLNKDKESNQTGKKIENDDDTIERLICCAVSKLKCEIEDNILLSKMKNEYEIGDIDSFFILELIGFALKYLKSRLFDSLISQKIKYGKYSSENRKSIGRRSIGTMDNFERISTFYRIIDGILTNMNQYSTFRHISNSPMCCLYRSYIKFKLNEHAQSISLVKQCIEKYHLFGEAYLFLATVLVYLKKFDEAAENIKIGLSHNFDLSETPMYFYISACITEYKERNGMVNNELFQKRKASMDKSRNSLHFFEQALEMDKKGNFFNQCKSGNIVSSLSFYNKFKAYIGLIKCFGKLNDKEKLINLEDSAKNFFKTSQSNYLEEEKFIINAMLKLINAKISQQSGDTEKSLKILTSIENKDSVFYIKSRKKMSKIYLQKNNKKLYISCFKDISNHLNSEMYTTSGYIMLGDAYLKIFDMEQSIESYKTAYQCKSISNKKKIELLQKMAHVYCQSLSFQQAVNCYILALSDVEKHLKLSNDEEMDPYLLEEIRYQLAKLYVKMTEYQKSHEILLKIVKNEEKDVENISSKSCRMFLFARVYNLLATTIDHIKNQNSMQKMEFYEKSISLISNFIKQVKIHGNADIDKYVIFLVHVGTTSFDQFFLQHEYDKIILYSDTVLRLSNNNTDVAARIIKTHLALNNVDKANHIVLILTNLNVSHVKIKELNLEILIHNMELSKAKDLCDEIFIKYTSLSDVNYDLLLKYIDINYRLGDQKNSQTLLKNLLERFPKIERTPAYQFCNGLYYWYTDILNKCCRIIYVVVYFIENNIALSLFNKSRTDTNWQCLGTEYCINICLNPNRSVLFWHTENYGSVEMKQNLLHLANVLLNYFNKEKNKHSFFILRKLATLALGSNKQAEEVISSMEKMDPQLKNVPSSIYVIGVSNMIIGNVGRSRTVLRKTVDMVWTHSTSTYLEKCWLLLSEIYIQNNKYDAANEILDLCVKYNKSCFRAIENKALIYEIGKDLENASKLYQQAWELCGRKNCTIGYKLAFNLLKLKRLTGAIDVSTQH
ncbi:TPR repeat protein 21B, partial [Intoshia linei]